MKNRSIVCLTALCVLSLAMTASATTWTAGTGAWETAGNWDAGAPVIGTSAQIDNGGTANSTAIGNAVRYFTVGNATGNGTVNISAGDLTADKSTYLANAGGTGTINVSGGAYFKAQYLGIGLSSGGTGHVTVSDAASEIGVFNGLDIGSGGTGTLVVDAGKVTTSGGADVYIGRYAGSDGTLTLKNGGRLYTGGMHVGENATATATINVEPGGYLSSSYYLYAGYYGSAQIIQTGGNVLVGGSSSGLSIAGGNGSSCSYTISAGVLDLKTSTTNGTYALRLGGWGESYTGAGTLTVVGSAATITTENYNQYSSGTLESEITSDGISLITVVDADEAGNGVANLDGVFNIVDSGAANGTYDIITASTINGDFDSVTVGGVDIDTLSDWSYAINGSTLSVTVIPEPATLGLVIAFGGALVAIRRKLMI